MSHTGQSFSNDSGSRVVVAACKPWVTQSHRYSSGRMDRFPVFSVLPTSLQSLRLPPPRHMVQNPAVAAVAAAAVAQTWVSESWVKYLRCPLPQAQQDRVGGISQRTTGIWTKRQPQGRFRSKAKAPDTSTFYSRKSTSIALSLVTDIL